MSADLLPAESARLAELEAVVTDGLATFVTVGRALAEIRDSRLYRQTHDTFEAYCQQHWSLSRSRAYRIIEAATITESLSPIGDTPAPANEGQARELTGLPADTAAEVMRKAHDATAGKVTASAIRQAREDVAPKPTPTPSAFDASFDAGGEGVWDDFPDEDDEPAERDLLAEKIRAELEASDQTYRELAHESTPQPKRQPEPALSGDRLDRYDGEKRSAHLGAACVTLRSLTWQLPRRQFIEAWRSYPEGASPAQREQVGPDQFREYADALLTLATEWETTSA